jgi:hypothetical protein
MSFLCFYGDENINYWLYQVYMLYNGLGSTSDYSILELLTKEEIFPYNIYTDLLPSLRYFCLRIILAYIDVLCVADRL